MKSTDFDPISPGAARFFTHDLYRQLAVGEFITGIPTWELTVAADSPVNDPDPASRLVAGTTQVEGQKTRQKIGNCIAGVKYVVAVIAETTFGNTPQQWCYLRCEVVE